MSRDLVHPGERSVARDQQPRNPRGRDPLERGVSPRGLHRDIAARYVGIGVTKFDEMVLDGRMPQPRRIDGRKVWDRFALDEAFDALPIEGENEWDSVLRS